MFSKDYVQFDAEFEKTLKEYGVEDKLEDKKTLATAYNEHMAEKISDKNQKVMRFMSGAEILDILETGKIKEFDGSVGYKSFTVNEKHKYSNYPFHMHTIVGDYDFEVLKATAYPRTDKTIKDGQFVRPHDLEQEELRLKTNGGVNIKKTQR